MKVLYPFLYRHINFLVFDFNLSRKNLIKSFQNVSMYSNAQYFECIINYL